MNLIKFTPPPLGILIRLSLEINRIRQTAKILLLFSGLLILPFLTFPQMTFNASEVQLSSGQLQEMDSFISGYTIFDFNTYALNNYVKSGMDSVHFSIYINDTLNWDFHLKEKDVLSDNFVLMYTTPSGKRLASHRSKTSTYRGYADDSPEGSAFFYISKDGIQAEFTAGGVNYIIEPGGHYTTTDGYVLYRRENRNADPAFGPAISVRSEPCQGPNYPDCSCYEDNWENGTYYLELAIEMDCEFVRDRIWKPGIKDEEGMRIEVEDFLGKEIPLISKAYEDAVNMQVIVVFAHFWMPELNPDPLIPPTCTGSADPYPETIDIINYWNEFRSYWNEHFSFVNRDWAHVYSGIELSQLGVSEGEPFNGYASICGANDITYQPPNAPYNYQSYSVSRRKDADWTVVAHEIGHGFGLQHTHGCNDAQCSFQWATCTIMENCCSERQECFSFYPCGSNLCQAELEKNITNWKYHETEQHRLCTYLNGYNSTLHQDNNICLLAPPPVGYNFEILIQNEDVILMEDDVICLNEEIDVSFYNTFNLVNFSWDIGSGLTLVSGTINDPAITLKGIINGITSQVCATFDYNGQPLTFCRNIHIGVPLSPGAPIINYYSNNGTPYVSIGFPLSNFASFFDYSWSVTDDIGNIIDYNSGTTTNPNPLVSPVYLGNCVNITINAGNECGVNPYTPYNPLHTCFQGQNLVSLPPDETSTAQSNKMHDDSKTTRQKSSLTENNRQFKIYPNPSSGSLFAILPAFRDISELRIIDLNGRIVFKQAVGGSAVLQTEINANHLPSGTYRVQLIQDDHVFQEKLKIVR